MEKFTTLLSEVSKEFGLTPEKEGMFGYMANICKDIVIAEAGAINTLNLVNEILPQFTPLIEKLSTKQAADKTEQ